MNRLPVVLGVLLAIGTSATAVGDERAWVNPDGGVFGTRANWDAGGVPVDEDDAVFNLRAAYTVDVLDDRRTARAVVRDGIVRFTVAEGTTYWTDEHDPLRPSLLIAEAPDDRATLSLLGGAFRTTTAELAQSSGSLGALSIAGHLQVDQVLHVGKSGVGTLDVTTRGSIGASRVTIGRGPLAYGSMTVRGPEASMIVGETLVTGDRGTGFLEIADTAFGAVHSAIIGMNDGADGHVVIRGADTRLDVTHSLDVGFDGDGVLVIEAGAAVTTGAFATIGTFPSDDFDPMGVDGVGQVIVTGPGSRWTIAGSLTGGDLHVGVAGIGFLEIADGGRVEVAGDLFVNDNSTEGDLDLVTLELSAPTDQPIIDVGGAVWSNIAGPGLRVELGPSSRPTPGDLYALVSATGGLEHIDLRLPGLPTTLLWSVQQSPGAIVIGVVDGCIPGGPEEDCNDNGVHDACDLSVGTSADCNGNGIPDECEFDADCNANGILDACEIADGLTEDCNANGVPDACEMFSVAATVDPPNPPTEARFGQSLARYGNLVVVGAPSGDDGGAVYVYRDEGARFVLEAAVRPDDGRPGDRFGRSVAVHDGVIAVGAPSTLGLEGGAVHLYRRRGATWVSSGRLSSPVERNGGWFGWSVAFIDGDELCATSITIDPATGLRNGLVHFLAADGDDWTEIQRLPANDAGFVSLPPVAIAETRRVVVGAHNVSGTVHVFEKETTNWEPTAIIRPRDPTTRFGTGLAIPMTHENGTLVIAGTNAGDPSLFVYKHDGDAWTGEALLRSHFPLDPPWSFAYRSVQLAGDRITVGGHTFEGNSGRVERFDRVDRTWCAASAFVMEPDAEGAAFGAAVSFADGRVVVGAPGDGDGSLRVFDLVADCNANNVPDICDIDAGTSIDDDGNAIPDECECLGNVDADDVVGITDLLAVLANWGPCAGCAADIDADGDVGFTDLLFVLSNWGSCE